MGRVAPGISWGEAGHAAKYPTMHWTASTSKNDLAQNVSNAEVQKPWSKLSLSTVFGEVLGLTEHESGKNLLSEASHVIGKWCLWVGQHRL